MLKKSRLALAFLLTILLVPVSAQESDIPKALLLVFHDGGEGQSEDVLNVITYTETAAINLLRRMNDSVVIRYVTGGDGWISEDAMRQAAIETGSPYVMALVTHFGDNTLLWRYDYYSRKEDSCIATDAFFITLIAGVESAETINASLERLQNAMVNAKPSQLYDGAPAVTMGQKFSGDQDGVEVWYGGQDGVLAGVIENGELDGKPVLFSRGHKVYAQVRKGGYWPKEIELPEGITNKPVELPMLMKKTKHSLSFNYAWRVGGPMPGMEEMKDAINSDDIELNHAGNFEYRLHLLPDRLFLQTGWGFWSDNTALSDDHDALHHEVRLGPGLYLLPRNDFPFRLLAGTGFALVFSDNGTNFQADPLWLGAEYHFPNWAVVSQLRIPNMLGYERDEFQESKTGEDGLYFSMGVMLKW